MNTKLIRLKKDLRQAGNHTRAARFPAGIYSAALACNLPNWEEEGKLFIQNGWGNTLCISSPDWEPVPRRKARKELGEEYRDTVGYNPFEEDPLQIVEDVASLLWEVKAEIERERLAGVRIPHKAGRFPEA
tara:strand:- start:477 stop:869 length:393 start_codon:yes stop_codon:yes gene_type:complete